MNIIFQISQQDIDRSSTLEQSDMGSWCYIINGCISGFHDEKVEAEQALLNMSIDPYTD